MDRVEVTNIVSEMLERHRKARLEQIEELLTIFDAASIYDLGSDAPYFLIRILDWEADYGW